MEKDKHAGGAHRLTVPTQHPQKVEKNVFDLQKAFRNKNVESYLVGCDAA